MNDLNNDTYIDEVRKKINDNYTYPADFYGKGFVNDDHGTCKYLLVYKL